MYMLIVLYAHPSHIRIIPAALFSCFCVNIQSGEPGAIMRSTGEKKSGN